MGAGHLYRCLSLAESLRDLAAEVTFICRDLPGNQCALVSEAGFPFQKLPAYDETKEFPWQEDANLTLAAMDKPSRSMVVDHYSIDSRWESLVAAKAPKILVIDDIANRPHRCSWLLDGGYVINGDGRYEKLLGKDASLLLGPAYALIRPQFSKARTKMARNYTQAKEVLVYFGSGDSFGSTLRFLEALSNLALKNTSVKILLSKNDPSRAEISTKAKDLSYVSILDTTSDMASLMLSADIFVGSGGMISWERACLGLPSIVATIAENQVPSTAFLAETGHILYLGPADQASPASYGSALQLLVENETIRSMLGRSSAKLVDGRGAIRVAKILVGEPITLRQAGENDRDQILEWRNHEFARVNSMDPEPIPHATHCAWYAKVLQDPDRAILMAEVQGKAVGTIRLERKSSATLVSIFLDPKWHRRGVGPSILEAGKSWVRKNWPGVTKLEAHIKEGNAPSISAFKRAGYRKAWSAYIAEL
jgi:UDP-2,4-diacetamido-2,4,6-trideoxy-beta-L-altropyranose hydrolase